MVNSDHFIEHCSVRVRTDGRKRVSDGYNESVHPQHNNSYVRGWRGLDVDRDPTAIHEAEAMGLLARRRGNGSKNAAACPLDSLVNFDQSPNPLSFHTQKSQIISLSRPAVLV
jgi:hypothetical protein